MYKTWFLDFFLFKKNLPNILKAILYLKTLALFRAKSNLHTSKTIKVFQTLFLPDIPFAKSVFNGKPEVSVKFVREDIGTHTDL